MIALLPEPFAGRVLGMWESMEREFGVPRGYPGAVPHLTFHIGNHDTDTGAGPIVHRVARETPPLTVFTAGLGVFGSEPPVVHLVVARSPAVASLAERLRSSLAAAGFEGTDPYFAADRWIPHITIAHRNLAGVEMGPVLGWLAKQDLAWEIPLRAISVARETDRGAEILETFPLAGR